MYKFIVVLAFLLTTILTSESAYSGDEEYGNLKGVFYIFASNGIYSLDPFSQNLKKIIDYGSPGFGDSVYTRNQARTKHLVYSSDATNNKMLVIDTDTNTLLATPKIASRVVHVYTVKLNDEVWAHSDGTGTFDVFHLNVPEHRTNWDVSSKVTSRVGFIFVTIITFLYCRVDMGSFR